MSDELLPPSPGEIVSTDLPATVRDSGLFPPTLSALLAEIQERFHIAHRCQGCGVDEGMRHIEACPLWRKANGMSGMRSEEEQNEIIAIAYTKGGIDAQCAIRDLKAQPSGGDQKAPRDHVHADWYELVVKERDDLKAKLAASQKAYEQHLAGCAVERDELIAAGMVDISGDEYAGNWINEKAARLEKERDAARTESARLRDALEHARAWTLLDADAPYPPMIAARLELIKQALAPQAGASNG